MMYWTWRTCLDMVVAPACFEAKIYVDAWRFERWFYGLLGWLWLTRLPTLGQVDPRADRVLDSLGTADRWGT